MFLDTYSHLAFTSVCTRGVGLVQWLYYLLVQNLAKIEI